MDHSASHVQYMWVSQVDLRSQQGGVHRELVPIDTAEAKVGFLNPRGGICPLVDVDPKPCLAVPDEDPQKVFWTESYPSGMHISEGSCCCSWPVVRVT